MEEKLSLLAELIKLSKCDKKTKEEEYAFLLVIAEQLGIKKNEFDKIFNEFINFKSPKLESDRILQFQRLVLLMNIDNEIKKEELDFIHDLGIKMGLNPLATNQVLKEMYKYPNKLIPPEDLIKIFKKHHN